MNIKEFNIKTLDRSQKAANNGHQMKPSIFCKDGFSMSVQGSSAHYCNPRSVSIEYLSMEIGFPSEKEESIMEYMDGDLEDTDPTDTVYGYVPVEIIDQIIIKHRGIDISKTFKKK